MFKYDIIAPTVTLESVVDSPNFSIFYTNVSPVPFSISFSESIISFADSDGCGPVGGSMRLRLQWAVAMRCALSSLNLTEIRIARAGSMGQRPAQQRHGGPLGDVRRGLRSGMP